MDTDRTRCGTKLPHLPGELLRRSLHLCVSVCICGVIISTAGFGFSAAAKDTAGEDWPQFLGPHANGTSGETGLLDRWPSNGPPLVWDKKIGAGYGAPSVRGNRLVLHHRIGDEDIIE